MEALGSDLSKIEKEVEKLKIVLDENAQITPELIEQHVGFSKDFNNFELIKQLECEILPLQNWRNIWLKTPKTTHWY